MKRLDKYKCKYDSQWLQNCHDDYVCPSCGLLYNEISISAEEYIGMFPISDTILVEQ